MWESIELKKKKKSSHNEAKKKRKTEVKEHSLNNRQNAMKTNKLNKKK